MYCRKSVCTGRLLRHGISASARSRHAEVLQRIGDGAGDLVHISGEAGLPRNIGVDGGGSGVALLLGDDGLVFEKRREEVVRILKSPKSENGRGVDLVQN